MELLAESHWFWGAWAPLCAQWVQAGTQCFPFTSPQVLGFHGKSTWPHCSLWFCSNHTIVYWRIWCWELKTQSREGIGYAVFAIIVLFFTSGEKSLHPPLLFPCSNNFWKYWVIVFDVCVLCAGMSQDSHFSLSFLLVHWEAYLPSGSNQRAT